MRAKAERATKTLEQLRRSLPIEQPSEESGAMGWHGDMSGDQAYVTDGHLLLLRSAIPIALAVNLGEYDGYYSKKPDKDSIEKVWGPVRDGKGIEAKFIGCAELLYDRGGRSIALAAIRDSGGRVMVVAPHLLAFAIQHVSPDSLSFAEGVRALEQPLAFKRGGELVAVLMPMRYTVTDLKGYDLEGEPVELQSLNLQGEPQ